jgi:hypothetical protein
MSSEATMTDELQAIIRMLADKGDIRLAAAILKKSEEVKTQPAKEAPK